MLATEDEKFLKEFDELLLKYQKGRGREKRGKVLIIWGPTGELVQQNTYHPAVRTSWEHAAKFDTIEEAKEFIDGNNWQGKPRFTDFEKTLCIKVQEIE